MPCYSPLQAWSHREETGKKEIYFGRRRSVMDTRMDLKCQQCIGCRLDKSREWALRCKHEAEYHDANSFITLTFEEDPITLSHVYFQDFLKRLRYYLRDRKVSYYMCGEYGSVYDEKGQKKPGLLGRPHFHALLFGYGFPDRTFFKKSPTGFPIYNSDLLSKTWKHGYATTQDFTIEAAAYVARYVTKKITGTMSEEHYKKELITKDGEIITVKVRPEYTRMSLKPGIGKRWIEEHYGDMYPKDFVTAGGVKFKPPRYYDKYFESIQPEGMEAIKVRRELHAKENRLPQERLDELNLHKQKIAARLKRNL